MNFTSKTKLLFILAVTIFSLTIYSCNTSSNTISSTPSSEDGLDDLSSFVVEKSGAVLWGENCSRCHNAPDPTAFSDQQWDAIGNHMRVRAGLTADETKKIVKFLQLSN